MEAERLKRRCNAASILYAERGDLKQTQEFLGRARISTTADIYTHMDEKTIEQGVETLADEFWPGPIEVEGSNRIQAKAVMEWRAEIRNQLATAVPSSHRLGAYSQVSQRLYNMLVKPATSLIRNRDLIIVPCDPILRPCFRRTRGKQSRRRCERRASKLPSGAS